MEWGKVMRPKVTVSLVDTAVGLSAMKSVSQRSSAWVASFWEYGFGSS